MKFGQFQIKFQINVIFLIKPFWYMTKKSRQKLKYLENGKSFQGEIKAFFIIFKGLSVAKNCLRPESAPLNQNVARYIFLWRRGVVVITTAQLHSTKPELRFCPGSNPARGVLNIRDGDDLWQWSWLEIMLNTFRWSTISQKQFIIIINIIFKKFFMVKRMEKVLFVNTVVNKMFFLHFCINI